MKQNAAGLANIRILSTAVIITLSTTVSLYIGFDDLLRTRYIRNLEIYGSDISDKEAKSLEDIILENITKSNIEKKNVIPDRLPF